MTGEGEIARWGDLKKNFKNWERESKKEREGDFWVEKKNGEGEGQ
jgi:hypothetical protein